MLLSLLGMITTVFSFQMKEKKNLLIFQSIGTVFYLVSYIFADGGVAVLLNCVFLIRNLVFMNTDRLKKSVRYLSCALLCIGCVAVFVRFVLTADLPTSEYFLSFLPVIGGVFGTVAAVNTNVNRLRMLKLGDSSCWLVYNIRIGIGALGGIIGEILNISSIIIALLRFSKNKGTSIS